MPGEPGANARGCITLDVPCDAGACNEAEQRCESCPADARDRDGDSYVAAVCGGNDCDDSRSDVHPGAVELCDGAGVDEDCREATLGADVDADGAYGTTCCYQPADGARVCGTDCDDRDPAIGPGAPERCNGVDDDCDGAIDDGFDCVQGLPVTGTDACGRAATGACSATCTLPDAFFVSESASTCDYCDDSGIGLGEEIPYATEMLDTNTTGGWTAYGDARMTSSSPETWAIADGTGERGAVYSPTRVRLGYGDTFVQARVRTRANRTACSLLCSTPDALCGGWSLVVLDDPPTEWFPRPRPGIQVTWGFCDVEFDATGAEYLIPDDHLSLNTLPMGSSFVYTLGDTSTGVIPQQDGPSGTVQNQLIWIEITPDDPRTVVDESAVSVTGPFGTGLGCANNGTPVCRRSFTPGQWLNVGITASESDNDVSVFATGITTSSYGLCASP